MSQHSFHSFLRRTLAFTLFVAFTSIFCEPVDYEAEQKFQQQLSQVLNMELKSIRVPDLLSEVEKRLAEGDKDRRLLEAAGILEFEQRNYGKAAERLGSLADHTRNSRRLLALSHYEMKAYKKAADEFKEMVYIHSEKQDWEKFIDALIQSDRKKEAAEQYEAMLLRHPEDGKALAFLIDHYRKNKNNDKLIGILEKKLSRDSGNKELLLELARLFDEDSYRAIDYRKQYLELEPRNHEVAIELAAIYEKKGSKRDALELYEKHASRFEKDFDYNRKVGELFLQFMDKKKAAHHLALASDLKADDRELSIQVADVYRQMGEADRALRYYEKALDAKPEDEAVQDKVMALLEETKDASKLEQGLLKIERRDEKAHTAQYRLAKLYLDKGDKATAYAFTAKALENVPKESRYLELLPEVVVTDAQIEKHFADLRKLSIPSSDNGGLWFLLARGYADQKNHAKAAEAYEKAHATKPELLRDHRQAVLSLEAGGKPEAAARMAKVYLASHPNDVEVRLIQVRGLEKSKGSENERREAMSALLKTDPTRQEWYLPLARLELKKSDTAAAIEAASQGMQRQPDKAEAYHFLRPLLKDREDRRQLEMEVLKRLVELDAKNKDAYELDLANLHFRSREYQTAKRLYLGLAKSQAKSAELWYRLAQAEEQTGGAQTAPEYLAKAYALEPGNETYVRAYGKTLEKDAEIKAHLKLFEVLNGKSPSEAEKIKLAKAYFLNGDHKKAASEWKPLLKSQPELALREPMVARSFLAAGDEKAAREVFEMLHGANPNAMEYLEELEVLYTKAGDEKSRIRILEKIVHLNGDHKEYRLQLAGSKRKAGDSQGAIKEYGNWIQRHPKDADALTIYRDLAREAKDTLRLVEALQLLDKGGMASAQDQFQLAELEYKRTGDISRMEAMVSKHPGYDEGRAILARQYFSRGDIVKLATLESWLVKSKGKDAGLLEPLADVYAHRKKTAPAADAYLELLEANKSDRRIFDKALAYSKQHGNARLKEILAIGYASFPEDVSIQDDYAATLGNSREALTIYEKVVQKLPNPVTVAKAAKVALALKDDKASIPLLEKWTRMDPGAKEPVEQLVKLLGKDRKGKTFAEYAVKLAELNPDSHEAAYQAAQAVGAQQDKGKALFFLQRASQLQPGNSGYLKELGMALFEQGNMHEAARVLEDARKKLPRDEEIHWTLYRVRIAQGDKEKAASHLAFLNNAHPADSTYAFPLGRIYAEQNKSKLAADILGHKGLANALGEDLGFVLLESHLKAGNDGAANQLADELFRKYPERSKKNLSMALLFLKRGKTGEAEGILESLVRTEPTPKVYYQAGALQHTQGRHEKAVEYLSKADRYAHPELHLMLAQSLEALNRDKDAVRAYEDHYTQSGNKDVLKDLLRLHTKQKNTVASIDILNRLIDAYPKDYDYRAELANLYLQKGDRAQAEAQFEEIVSKLPQHPKANLYLGMSELRKGHPAQAAKLLTVGLRKHEDHAEGWLALGDAEAARNRPKQALDAYEKAFSIDGQNLPAALGKMRQSLRLKRTEGMEKVFADVISLDSNQQEAAMGLAEIRYNNKDYKGAVDLYAKAMAGGQAGGDQWARYGYALMEVGQVDTARDALQKASDMGEKSTKLLVSLARLQREKGNLYEAERALQDLLTQDAKNHMATFWLGQIAMDRNQEGVAEGHFKKAAALQPANAEYAEGLAKLYFGKGEYQKTLAALKPAKGDLSIEGMRMAGECLYRLGNTQAAYGAFEALYQAKPDELTAARMVDILMARNQFTAAQRFVEQSQFRNTRPMVFARARIALGNHATDQATELLENLLREDKRDAEVHHHLGLAQYQAKEYKQAYKSFRRATKFQHEYPEAVYYTGLTLLQMGKEDKSETYFRELTAHNDKSWRAKGFMGLARMFQSQSQFEAMEHHMQKSLQFQQSAEGMGLMAQASFQRKQLEQAESWAKKALQVEPGNATGTIALAQVLHARNQDNQALQLVRDALKESPNACELLVYSTLLNYHTNNSYNVQATGEQAIRLCPEEPAPHLYIGQVALKQYQKEIAEEHFKQFRKKGGDKSQLPEY